VIDRGGIELALADVARRFGLPGLSLDERGTGFTVNDVRIDLQPRERLGAIDVVAWLPPAPLSPARVSALLEANFCWQIGASFALEPMSGALVLQHRCPEDELANDGLPAAVERLVRQAIAWPRHLESIEDTTAVGAAPDSGGMRA
jgi:hypothetical protein